MSPRLLVTGARGLLGGSVASVGLSRNWQVAGVGRTAATLPGGGRILAVDLSDPSAAESIVMRIAPDLIVHAAAHTNVEWCEEHPEHARRLHVEGSEAIARAADRVGSRLMYISTDSVFDGGGPSYDELAPTAPRNVYAATKLEGEIRTLHACPDALVLRLNFFGVRASSRGRSLVEWALLELSSGRAIPGFTDVWFNPLWSSHLAEVVLDLASRSERGVLHLGASDGISKFEFLRTLAAAFGYPESRVTGVLAGEQAHRATRPLRTVLSVAKAEAILGRRMPQVRQQIHSLRDGSAGAGGPPPAPRSSS